MKRIGITAILLTAVLTANVFAITPYNERGDDFSAMVITQITNSNDCTIFHYTVTYDVGSPRALEMLLINYKPNILKKEFFYKIFGIADRCIEWRGAYISGSVNSSIKIRTLPIGEFIKINQNMIVADLKNTLKPGETVSLYIITKNQYILPGIGILEGARTIATWIFQDESEVPEGFDNELHTKKFPTIIPQPRPSTPIGVLEYMMGQMTPLYNMKLISDDKIFTQLYDKLTLARVNILAGSSKFVDACLALVNFRNQLSVERGKTVDENAYQMLFFISGELMGMLK